VFAVDLHVHTRFFHGFDSRRTLFDPLGQHLAERMARRTGLDGLAITNHDYAWHRPGDEPAVLPGIEISTTRGHVLVVGPDPPAATAPGELDPHEVVALAHDRECAAIMPHPFRNGDLPQTDAAFDAVEVNGKRLENRWRVEDLASERDVALVGGSDAHFPFEVGRVYTRVEAPDCSPAAIVDAIRAGNVEPAVTERPLDRLLAPIYDRVHRQKGHLVGVRPRSEDPTVRRDPATRDIPDPGAED
jgi:predicted metal-dependent phosphoesterase TrpH